MSVYRAVRTSMSIEDNGEYEVGAGATPGGGAGDDGTGFADERGASLRRMFPARGAGSPSLRPVPASPGRPGLAGQPRPDDAVPSRPGSPGRSRPGHAERLRPGDAGQPRPGFTPETG